MASKTHHSADARADELEQLPEYLVSATVEAAVRIVKWEASPTNFLSGPRARLVRDVLGSPMNN